MGLGNNISDVRIGGSPITKIYQGVSEIWLKSEFDLYIHSASGNDANMGTESNPVQSISRLQTLANSHGDGVKIKFLDEGYYREELTLSGNNAFVDANHSTFDGADIIAGTWQTSTDRGDAHSNVYSIAWTRDNPSPQATDYLRVWVDGVKPRYASSLSDLNTNGGYYVNDRGIASMIIYVNMGTNPNVDGKVYEAAIRDHGITTSSYNAVTGVSVKNVNPVRCLAHYNGLSIGTGGKVENILAEDGTLHTSVLACDVENYIALTIDKSLTNYIPLTLYKDNGAGLSLNVKKYFCLNEPDEVTAIGQAFHTHGSTAPLDNVTIESSYAQNINMFVMGNVANLLTVRNSFATNVDKFVSMGSDLLIENCMFLKGISDLTNFLGNHPGGVTNVTVRNCCIYIPSDFADSVTIADVRNFSGNITFEYCAILVGGNNKYVIATKPPDLHPEYSITFNNNVVVANTGNILRIVDSHSTGKSISYTADYNVYYNIASQYEASIGFTDSTGTNFQKLSTAQSNLGQELNSIFVGSDISTDYLYLFQNDPAAGDFRLRTDTGLTFADGTPITEAGVQQHYDWNLDEVVAGAPQRWPVVPTTYAEAETYVKAPEDWDFYPVA